MKKVKTLLPWLLYGLLSSFSRPIAIGIALLVSLQAYPRLKKGFLMEWTTVCLFGTSLVLTVFLHTSWYPHYEPTIITSLFAVITWTSLILNKPFTIQYAKEQVDAAYWNTPLFLRVNQWMTLFFCLFFSLTTTLNIILLYRPGLFSYKLIWLVLIPIKLLLLTKFPKWYTQRSLQGEKTS